MEQRTDSEDITTGSGKVENNEGNWIRRGKIKFKDGEKSEIDSETEERIREKIKGKMEGSTQGNNNNNKQNDKIKRANVKIGGKTGSRDEGEEGKWKGAKGENEEREGKNDKNNNNKKDGEGNDGNNKKKKFVEGKIRLIEGRGGPEPAKAASGLQAPCQGGGPHGGVRVGEGYGRLHRG